MTFAFKAIGSKDEVVAQLKAADDAHFGDLGKAVRDLVVSNLEATTGKAVHSADSWAVKYIVTGSGHGDSNSVSFSLEVHSHWVPNTDKGTDVNQVPEASNAESSATSDAVQTPVDEASTATVTEPGADPTPTPNTDVQQ